MARAGLLALTLSLRRSRHGRRHVPKIHAVSIWRNKVELAKIRQLYRGMAAQKRRVKLIRRKCPRRWWVRPLLQYHNEHGAWMTTIPIMKNQDPERFYRTFRMTPEAFDKLLEIVGPYLCKRSWRKPIPPGERLAITLMFLSSGSNYEVLELYFLVADETISNIAAETTHIVWKVLGPLVFENFSTDMWLRKASEFEALWNCVHCCGAIDGKHVKIQAPPRTGSRFFNYKDHFSLILMGVCDAKRKFLVVDVGSSGRRGDGNVYHKSKFGLMLRENKLHLPPACHVEGMEEKLPFFFVGDAAFERSAEMVTPFKGHFLTPERKVFNYRVSRARGNIEDAFGLLNSRYEIFQRPIRASYPTAKSIVLCCCALHNYHLLDEDSVPLYCRRNPKGEYADHVRGDGNKVLGRYKNENPALEKKIYKRLEAEVALVKHEAVADESPLDGEAVSEALIDHFIEKDLPWQWKSANLT